MKKSSISLIVILILLAVVTYFVMQRPGERSSPGESGQMLVHFDSSAIDRIELRDPAGEIVIEKTGGPWHLTSPLNYPADSGLIVNVLNQANRIELKNVVSSNPEKQSLFQVDSAGVHVRLTAQGVEKAAFIIGKPSSTFSETYVRRDGSPDVYLAEGYLQGTFKRKANDLRDKTIFKTDAAGVTRVTYHYGDTTFTLALNDSVWQIGKANANAAVVRPLLQALANIQADDFIDSAMAPGKAVVAIDLAGTQVRLFRDAKGGRYLIQTSSSPQWFTSSDWRVQSIIKRQKDLLPPA